MAIVATLTDVKVQQEQVVLTVKFTEDAVTLGHKDFYWPLASVATLTLADIQTVVNTYKTSLGVQRNRITWLKSRIGQEI